MFSIISFTYYRANLRYFIQVIIPDNDTKAESPRKLADVLPVLEWLRSLGLAKYEEVFIREEIDWDTLQGLKEEVTKCPKKNNNKGKKPSA